MYDQPASYKQIESERLVKRLTSIITNPSDELRRPPVPELLVMFVSQMMRAKEATKHCFGPARPKNLPESSSKSFLTNILKLLRLVMVIPQNQAQPSQNFFQFQ